jgi:membrane-bound inhibitor of C-type lysozyme/uncharacterized membrane protein
MKRIMMLLFGVLMAKSTLANTLSFECQDGYTFKAQQQHNAMLLYLPRKQITLPQVDSTSGVKFSDGTMTLLTKGREAFFSPDVIGGALACTCDGEVVKQEYQRQLKEQKPSEVEHQEIPKKPSIKPAVSNKVVALSNNKPKNELDSFAALGHKPEWLLHIENADQGIFSYENNQSQMFKFTLPPARRSGDSLLYMYKDLEHQVMIELHDRRCIDRKSKEQFNTIVWVKLDGRTFKGCGNVVR